ncbi:hypothetical protein [Endozoicomonas sp. SESOKO1]|uniref:hypothetical protein n=1 Tax=Endozoicomonas sp. SESOKO1 TaxID=2828742 RepID=UPI002148A06D|nr:hypothetical protein [Endozoicomonas sp. SESOKO1]
MSANNLVSHRLQSNQVGAGSGKRNNQQAISTAQGQHVAKQGFARQRGSIQAGQMAKTHQLDDPLSSFIDAGTKLFSLYGDHREQEEETIRAEDANEIQLRYKAFKAEEARQFASMGDLNKFNEEDRKVISKDLRSQYFSNVRHKGLMSKLDERLDFEINEGLTQELYVKAHKDRTDRVFALTADELSKGTDLASLEARFVTGGELTGDVMSQTEFDGMLLKMYQTDKRNPALAEAIENSSSISEETKATVRTEQEKMITVEAALSVERAVKKGDVQYLLDYKDEAVRFGKYSDKEYAKLIARAEATKTQANFETQFRSLFRQLGSTDGSNFRLGTNLPKELQDKIVNDEFTRGDQVFKDKAITNNRKPIPILRDKISVQLENPMVDGKLTTQGDIAAKELWNVIQLKGGVGNAMDYFPDNLKPFASAFATYASVVGEADAMERVLKMQSGALPKPRQVAAKDLDTALDDYGSWNFFNDTKHMLDNPEVRAYAYNALKMQMEYTDPDHIDDVTGNIMSDINNKFKTVEGESLSFHVRGGHDLVGFFNEQIAGRVKDKTFGDFLESEVVSLLPEFRDMFNDQGIEAEELGVRIDTRDPSKLIAYVKDDVFKGRVIDMNTMIDRTLERENWSTYYDESK